MAAKTKCSVCHHYKNSHQRASEGGCVMRCKCTRFHGPLENAVKMTTADYRSRLMAVEGDPMCWEAALAAFGIVTSHDDGFRRPEWITSQLEKAGWEVRVKSPATLLPESDEVPAAPTLATVMPYVTSGDWLLMTSHHVIAVRDGVVTDTTGTEATVKRRVWRACQVKRAGLPVPVQCGCFEPLVFGHASGHRWNRGNATVNT